MNIKLMYDTNRLNYIYVNCSLKLC